MIDNSYVRACKRSWVTWINQLLLICWFYINTQSFPMIPSCIFYNYFKREFYRKIYQSYIKQNNLNSLNSMPEDSTWYAPTKLFLARLYNIRDLLYGEFRKMCMCVILKVLQSYVVRTIRNKSYTLLVCY